ncbi:class I SAM-dependent methyltransferase [Candidatus Dependentiae bacterium]|nr:class I SAM-dependent methyltransferase [Candidatus Dependentiae bacterium]
MVIQENIDFWNEAVSRNKEISVIGFNALDNYPMAEDHGELREAKHFFKPISGGKKLDISCGYSRFLFEYAEKGLECQGFDFSPEMIKIGKISAESKKLKIAFYENTIDNFNLPNIKFYYIWCHDATMYLSRYEISKLFNLINRYLKKDGIAFVEFRNKFYVFALFTELSKFFLKTIYPGFRHAYSILDAKAFSKNANLIIKDIYAISSILFPLYIPKNSFGGLKFSTKGMPDEIKTKFIPLFPVFIIKLFQFLFFSSLKKISKAGFIFPAYISKEFIFNSGKEK